MRSIDWLQLALFVAALAADYQTAGPLPGEGARFAGLHLSRLDCEAVRAGDVPDCGINPREEQGWIGYTVSMLAFSMIGCL